MKWKKCLAFVLSQEIVNLNRELKLLTLVQIYNLLNSKGRIMCSDTRHLHSAVSASKALSASTFLHRCTDTTGSAWKGMFNFACSLIC